MRTRSPTLPRTLASAGPLRTACVGQNRAGMPRILATLKSGSPVSTSRGGPEPGATPGKRPITAGSPMRQRIARNRPHRKCCGAREPSKRDPPRHKYASMDLTTLRSGAFGRRGQSLLLGAVAEACRSHRRHLDAWESGPYSPRAGVLRLSQMRTAQVPGPSSQLKA